MKTIFLLPPPALPVPAVRGGAVEGLLTHLIEEHERQGRAHSALYEHYRHSSSCSKRTVYRQIRKIQDPERNINSQCHDPPDNALRRCSRHSAEQRQRIKRHKIIQYHFNFSAFPVYSASIGS